MIRKQQLNTIILLLLGIHLNAQNIYQWRGEERSGHYPQKNMLTEWPIEGPELILHVDSLPETYSSVILKDNVLYTTGISKDDEILTAISMEGKILWSTVYGKAWSKSYPLARTTPTIVDNKIYVISGSGDIACINSTNGKILWGFDAHEKFEGSYHKWGVGESPLVFDDKVIYTAGGNKTTLVAMNKDTGETIWKTKSLNDKSSYCSPVLSIQDDIKLIITVTFKNVLGIDGETGEILWQFDYLNEDKPLMGSDINPITPLVKGKEIFVTSGYNHVAIMFEMADDFRSVSVKWKSKELDVHIGGVVEYDGYIYGANFISMKKGDWTCLDWATGEVKYQQPWNFQGSIIETGGYLICYDEARGNVGLVKATPEGFNVKSTFKVPYGKGPHWAHPTFYDDKLIIRHGKDLMVYKAGSN